MPVHYLELKALMNLTLVLKPDSTYSSMQSVSVFRSVSCVVKPDCCQCIARAEGPDEQNLGAQARLNLQANVVYECVQEHELCAHSNF